MFLWVKNMGSEPVVDMDVAMSFLPVTILSGRGYLTLTMAGAISHGGAM